MLVGQIVCRWGVYGGDERAWGGEGDVTKGQAREQRAESLTPLPVGQAAARSLVAGFVARLVSEPIL